MRTDRGASLATVAIENGKLTLSHPWQPQASVTYRIDLSTDLIEWRDETAAFTQGVNLGNVRMMVGAKAIEEYGDTVFLRVLAR